jgi:hypothetical protein
VAPVQDYLAPARRASVLMWVVGGLIVAAAVCCVGMGFILPRAQLPPETQAQFNQFQSESGFSITSMFIVVGVMFLLAGVLTIVFGFVARGGTLGRVIAALIFNVLVVLLALLLLVMGLIAAASGKSGGPGGPGVELIVNLCMWSVPLALYGVALLWLIQAVKNSSAVAAMAAQQQAQYQAQYWQYQQAAQAYGYGAGGAGTPPAPPQAPASPVPPPAAAPPSPQPPPPDETPGST